MQNFKTPYFSNSLQEFWSRCISLSTFLNDYIFLPLALMFGKNLLGLLMELLLLFTLVDYGMVLIGLLFCGDCNGIIVILQKSFPKSINRIFGRTTTLLSLLFCGSYFVRKYLWFFAICLFNA